MNANITPEWLTYEGAAQYSGLSARTLENLVRDQLVISSNVKAPGNSRGRRLIKRASLDAYIEAGINEPPSEIAMNKGRKLSTAPSGA